MSRNMRNKRRSFKKKKTLESALNSQRLLRGVQFTFIISLILALLALFAPLVLKGGLNKQKTSTFVHESNVSTLLGPVTSQEMEMFRSKFSDLLDRHPVTAMRESFKDTQNVIALDVERGALDNISASAGFHVQPDGSYQPKIVINFEKFMHASISDENLMCLIYHEWLHLEEVRLGVTAPETALPGWKPTTLQEYRAAFAGEFRAHLAEARLALDQGWVEQTGPGQPDHVVLRDAGIETYARYMANDLGKREIFRNYKEYLVGWALELVAQNTQPSRKRTAAFFIKIIFLVAGAGFAPAISRL